ncbi:MAG: hypothetical protein HY220_01700 [Candidatus Sungbacteria bacterium]|uniref:Type 4 fimbrial biogenesis protein PilX N-terminal domain-containing protein n=1 Tax=Candidatus Sungiibacteriota bacterium TaxID=2750080 RepID=A0A9D6LRL8_9BACT|nr:hypothetical protein [Candidatus Sungbacteria bacterium]
MPKRFTKTKEGITLLLVILVLSALLTISFGIFNISFTEFRISGDLQSSFKALYAADQMLEYGLYRDRVQADCAADGSSCSVPTNISSPNPLASGACATLSITRNSGQTTVTSVGQFDCIAGSLRLVKRAFRVTY